MMERNKMRVQNEVCTTWKCFHQMQGTIRADSHMGLFLLKTCFMFMLCIRSKNVFYLQRVESCISLRVCILLWERIVRALWFSKPGQIAAGDKTGL